MPPSVSVILSVHNGEPFLADALESVLHQTFRNFEFLVVDDSSTDNSRQVLEDYAKRYVQMTLVDMESAENIGLTRCLNHLLGLANGEFIARMDADDICHLTRFERQCEMMHANPDFVCLGTAVKFIDNSGEFLGKEINPKNHSEIEQRLLKGFGGTLRHPTAMIRKDALMSVGGYCEKYRTAQDLDLYLKLARVGQLANTEEVLLSYRIHPQSTNFSRTDQQDLDVEAMLRHAYKERGMRFTRRAMAWRFNAKTDRLLKSAKEARQRRQKLRELDYVLRAIQAAPWRKKGYYCLAEVLVGETIAHKLYQLGGAK